MPKNIFLDATNTPNQSMNPIMNLHYKPQKRQWDGPIYLPKSIYVHMNEASKEALKKYDIVACKEFQNRTVQEAFCCLDDPLLLQVQNQQINPSDHSRS